MEQTERNHWLAILRTAFVFVAVATGTARAAGPAWLGVHVTADEASSKGGVLVERVLLGSPAESAGILVGDVIVEIDGHELGAPSALRERIATQSAGDRVAVVVERAGARRTLDVRLGERPDAGDVRAFALQPWAKPGGDADEARRHAEAMKELAETLRERELDARDRLRWLDEHGAPHDLPAPRIEGWLGAMPRPILGVELIEVTPELRRHLGTDREAGVLVGRVVADSAAEAAGIRVGDLILSIDGEEVRTAAALASAVRSRAGTTAAVEVLREGTVRRLDVDLPAVEAPRPFARS